MIPVQDAPTRPALRYYGGKHRLAAWIISHFPPHKNYVEPCCGACSVLLQKPRSPLETVNDLDGNVVNFFRVLRDKPDELIRKIRLTPWSRAEYELCRDFTDKGDEVERARRFWICCIQSIQGGPDPSTCTSGWRLQKENGENGHYDYGKGLLEVARRFYDVQIESRDAIEIIKRYDNKETLFYFDPPYPPSTRTHTSAYGIEQKNTFHIEAATLLRQAQGYVVVSGYACPLYTELYELHSWRRFDKEASGNAGSKRIESLWLSPRTVEALHVNLAGLPLFEGMK